MSTYTWTQRQEREARTLLGKLKRASKRTFRRIAAMNGCEPWEVVADALAGSRHVHGLKLVEADAA